MNDTPRRAAKPLAFGLAAIALIALPALSRDRGAQFMRPQSFANQVMAATAKAGHTGFRFGRNGRVAATSRFGRGRFVRSTGSIRSSTRRVIVKARIIRHNGNKFRSAPLAKHISYLQRDEVSREGREAELFGREGLTIDGDAFAERCEGDRHHFRFTVSPEDGVQMDNLKGFAVDLMARAERDLGTKLDWVGVEHWNTDQPHVHILVRGRAEDGADLVIAKDYISRGLRARAEELVTLELGPRQDHEIEASLVREVTAERWTGLDRSLQIHSDENAGLVDLRLPNTEPIDRHIRNLLVGRAQHLERLGLAVSEGSARWRLMPGLEGDLRDISVRGDIIKTMHQVIQSRDGRAIGTFAIHERPDEPIIGRLADQHLRKNARSLVSPSSSRINRSNRR